MKKSKKCPTTKKTIYLDEKSAERGRFYIWSHDTTANIYDLHCYSCEHCGGWHIGHKSYFEKTKQTQIEITDTVSIGVD